jgi:hypothetical protein
MNRPTTESDVAVYGMIRSSSLFLFMTTIILRVCVCVRMRVCAYVHIHIKFIVNIFTY